MMGLELGQWHGGYSMISCSMMGLSLMGLGHDWAGAGAVVLKGLEHDGYSMMGLIIVFNRYLNSNMPS